MAQTINTNDDESFRSFLNTSVNTVFKFNPITDKTVKDIITNLNSKHSSGFDDISTVLHALLELVDRITNDLDQGQISLAIFLDLSKAFNTLDLNILLYKLKFYGIRDTALKWFESYLINRPHYVQIQEYKSDIQLLSLGVPQGSILGPLLFSIYLNDIQYSSPFFKFINYADDTTLLNSLKLENKNILKIINNEFEKVYNWLCFNRLSLNVEKTKYMVFHNKFKNINYPELRLFDRLIDRVENFDFLGIVLNQNLNWNSHLDKISIKISRSIGAL